MTTVSNKILIEGEENEKMEKVFNSTVAVVATFLRIYSGAGMQQLVF